MFTTDIKQNPNFQYTIGNNKQQAKEIQVKPKRRIFSSQGSAISPLKNTSIKQNQKGIVIAPSNTYPVVVLPGFGNNSTDYIEPYGLKEQGLKHNLEKRGFQCFIVPVNRGDWAKVFRMLLTLKYFRSQCQIDPGYRWYLDRVHDTIQVAIQSSGLDKVHIVGHSAGGWLARAFIGDKNYQQQSYTNSNGYGNNNGNKLSQQVILESNVSNFTNDVNFGKDIPTFGNGQQDLQGGFDTLKKVSQSETQLSNEQLNELSLNQHIASIVTLGSPQGTGARQTDRTGGTLRYINKQFPGAYFKMKGVNYICVSGRSVKGERSRNVQARSSYNSYLEVCGEGDVEGDGVVPCESATLQGATNLVIDGVTHSMLKNSFKEPQEYVWYGSDSIIDTWLKHLVNFDEQ